ncbi:MAG: TIGR02757 family protein, partial [Bacteroidetes bacterium HGW-Bacteroidetes-22]
MRSLKDQLDNLLELYYHAGFIVDDPISIPHRFNTKQDIEISGFLVAILSWGKRSVIIKKASELMERMDNQPFDFTMNATDHDFRCLDGFVHRTIQPIDIHTL